MEISISFIKFQEEKKGNRYLPLWLKAQYNFLESLTYEERISELGLTQIGQMLLFLQLKYFLSATKWSGAKKIHVPKIGLSDGIIKTLYYATDNPLE